MIKNLSFKFVLVLLVLVVSVIITSSCYASETITYKDTAEITIDNEVGTIVIKNLSSGTTRTFEIPETYSQYYIMAKDDGSSNYNTTFNILFSNNFKWTFYNVKYYSYVNLSDLYLIANIKIFNSGEVSVGTTYTNPSNTAFYSYGLVLDANDNIYFDDYEDVSIVYSNHEIKGRLNTDNVIYSPNQLSVDVTHEFQSDTSAKVNFAVNNAPEGAVLQYSLTGVEINADLTAPIKLRNPVTYYPGTSNLQVKENTKVYWALYDIDGNCLLTDVYQVPEYDAVIENADKEIEYSVTYNEDYTSATIVASIKNKEFTDKLVYSEFSSLSLTTGKLEYGYQPFAGSLNVNKNGKYYFYAMDSFNNVFDIKVVDINAIFNFVESDFSYTMENKSSLHGGYELRITPSVKNWGSKVNIFYNIELTSGEELSLVNVNTDYPDESYVDSALGSFENSINAPHYFSGKIMSGDVIRIYSPSNQLEDLEGKITFKIYKKTDNSEVFVKSYTIHVNAFTAGNIVDGSSGNISGSLPNNSSNSGDFTNNDFGEVTWSDVENYVGTNGSFWSIIKTILNSLPKWITAPLFFFVSAVVAIALLKAILPF